MKMNLVVSLLPLSIDTVETLNNKHLEYQQLSSATDKYIEIILCLNIRKKENRGLDSITVELDGDCKLHCLDSIKIISSMMQVKWQRFCGGGGARVSGAVACGCRD